jgi:hypothetical protein
MWQKQVNPVKDLLQQYEVLDGCCNRPVQCGMESYTITTTHITMNGKSPHNKL